MRDKHRSRLPNAVRKWELEPGNEELLDVGTANVVPLLELNDPKNLLVVRISRAPSRRQDQGRSHT